jgi:hypothetical protein
VAEELEGEAKREPEYLSNVERALALITGKPVAPHFRAYLARLAKQAPRVLRGLNSQDPSVRRAWSIPNELDPNDALDIVENLADPPQPRGRPAGKLQYPSDDALFDEMHRMMRAEGISDGQAAKRLAPRAEGGSMTSEASRRRRLVRGYRNKYQGMVDK